MTKSELLEFLKNVPDDAEIRMYSRYSDGYLGILPEYRSIDNRVYLNADD
jgi:hypothetical protein